MAEIASRELRNRTAEVLRRVEQGESVTITVNGRPVAVLEPVHGRRWMPKAEFISKVLSVQADPGLTRELAVLIPDTTDDLPL
ncbi:MAG TPA: type II toxin-antitoxin system prevent-host-death family antitoxin [Chloroflexota bacterium]